MEKTTIRLGGVPEHFNLPIHLAIENGAFENRGLRVDWTTFEGGTGQMTKALREGSIDACVLLTEGIIKDIVKGNPSKIISEYVKTPLTWGIHTSAKNPLDTYQAIFDKQYAISRFGSGSHLMAIVDANSKGHFISKEQFSVIGNLEGALKALDEQEVDIFYWEKYTTKPYVDSGQLKRVGEFLTPWPCFVIAATDHILDKESVAMIRMLRTIHDSCDLFMEANNAVQLVSSRYDLLLEDAERWYHNTAWAIDGWVSNKMIKSVLYNLKTAGIIEQEVPIPDLIWKRERR